MSFPNSPVQGSTASVGSSNYIYNGYAWKRTGDIVGITGQQGAGGATGSVGSQGTAGSSFEPKIFSASAVTADYASYPAGQKTIFQYDGLTLAGVGGTSDFDSTGMTFDLAEGSITIKQDGVYQVVASHSWFDNLVIRTVWYLYIYKNGSKIPGAGSGYIRDSTGQEEMSVCMTRTMRLSAGDIITFHFENIGSIASGNCALLDSLFQIVRIY